MSDSILDQIIDSQHKSRLDQFDPQAVLSELLQLLDEREQQVLDMRYGFSAGKKRTLEDIGKQFSITRERVRQIESGAVSKIRSSENFTERKEVIADMIEQILDEVGGVIAEEKLFEKLEALSQDDASRSVIEFLLHKLIADHFTQVKQNTKMLKSWALVSASIEKHEAILDEVSSILDDLNAILSLSELHDELHKRGVITDKDELDHSVFEHMLHTASDIKQNPFGKWGKKDWSLISPKRMNDKIYLVLKNHGKPLHFTEIAEKINETRFDHKKAHPATVHNELILDNDRYVLIGRGIYALKEWGYKPGVVTDIIEQVLREQGPLTKQAIIDAVLEQRMVKKSTIALMLTNKELFKKLSDGRYDLADNK